MSCIGPKSSVAGGLGGISTQGNAIGPKSSVAGGLGGLTRFDNGNAVAKDAPSNQQTNLLEGVDLKNIKLE